MEVAATTFRWIGTIAAFALGAVGVCLAVAFGTGIASLMLMVLLASAILVLLVFAFLSMSRRPRTMSIPMILTLCICFGFSQVVAFAIPQLFAALFFTSVLTSMASLTIKAIRAA